MLAASLSAYDPTRTSARGGARQQSATLIQNNAGQPLGRAGDPVAR